MAIYIGCSLAFVLGVLGGVIGDVAFLKPASKQREHASFVALGLLVGFLIGMSESPLIAGAVTGGFTIAGTLIGKLWDQSATKTEASPVPIKVDWLLSLSAATLIGVVLGAGVRINGLLNFRDESIPAKLRPLGFTDDQIRVIMNRIGEKMDLDQIIKLDSTKGAGLQGRDVKSTPYTVDHSNDAGSNFDWHDYWTEMKDYDLNTDEGAKYVVDNLLDEKNKNTVPAAIRTVIASGRKMKKKDTEIASHLKALTEVRP